MEQMTTYILTSLVVFLMIALALYMVFGAPQCDSIANTTALQLVQTINQVADDDFPYFNTADPGNNVPTDSSVFRTAPIRLCQNLAAYSLLNQFFGGEPEYQMYFEQFPEGFLSGGAGMWTEAYPWSGGAGGNLMFWGVLRGITIGAKYVSLGKAFGTWKIGTLLKRVGDSIRNARKISKFVELFENADDLMKAIKEDPDIIKDGLSAAAVAGVINKHEAESVLDALKNAEFIEDEVAVIERKIGTTAEGKEFSASLVSVTTREGKIPLRDSDVALKVTVLEKDGLYHQKTVWVKWKGKAGESEIEDIALLGPNDPPKGGYETIPINPAEEFKKYVNEMATINEKKVLNEIFEPDWTENTGKSTDLIRVAETITDDVLNTNSLVNTGLWNKLQVGWKNFKTRLTFYERAGYSTNKLIDTPIENKARALALLDWLNEDTYRSLEQYHPFTRLKYRIASALSIDPDRVTREAYYKYIKDVMKNTNGITLIPSESKWLVYKATMREIQENIQIPVSDLPIDELSKTVRSSLPEELASISDDELKSIIKGVKDSFDANELTFAENVNNHYLNNYLTEYLPDGTKNPSFDPKELTSTIGYLEQNMDAFPITPLPNYARLQGKKMVLLEARAMVTPTSWIAKGFAGLAMTEGCLGNSICVYSHGTMMEYPFYMSEETQKFFIRSWRPVGLQAYAGWQAALMHVPSHPRFYAVSPCFSTVKIWKTKYNGQDTIFIKPEKCDLGNQASNFCFADEDLINKYTAIWFASDVATVVETILTAGEAAVWKSVVKTADPVTLTQALAEATISWPGWPYVDLTYEKLQKNSNCTSTGLYQAIRQE